MANLFGRRTPPAPGRDPDAARRRETARALRDLTRLEPWATYRAQIAIIETQALQSLLTQGKDRHDYWQGYVEGLRTATTLPEKMAEQAQAEEKMG